MNSIKTLNYDVAVIGGGPGGLSAAIKAARQGVKVLLVEKSSCLGGAASSGLSILGYLDQKGNKALGGMAQEYYDRLERIGGSIGHYRCPVHNSISPISSEAFKLVAVEMCNEAGVDVLFNCELTDVKVENDRVRQVTVYGKCVRFVITAKIFIDGTGDGDVAYLAGAEYTSGQDGTGLMQPSTLVFAVGGYNFDEFYKYIEEHPEEAGIKEEYAKGYDLDFFRSTPGHCFIGLDKLVEKAHANGEFDIPRNQFIYIKTADEDTLVINTVRIINIDASDPVQLSAGLKEGYRQVGVLMNFMRKYMPGFEKAHLVRISGSLGIRETRHFIGKKRLALEDIRVNNQEDPDIVALCAYNIDIHSGNADHIDLFRVDKAFGIPYLCMVPKRIDGLFLAGRTISVDSTVFGAVRVMGPMIALGEAAGIAAAMCIKQDISPAEVDVDAVRKVILDNGGILKA